MIVGYSRTFNVNSMRVQTGSTNEFQIVWFKAESVLRVWALMISRSSDGLRFQSMLNPVGARSD
ncbi:hypothetical protein N7463_010771 [Penicillium fimorum]|uniref:Uncharacterized protein n=1 Tax=Penicillium fimorum TaxID=1882269 RepID=A0A9W9XKJ5_9EURO|nr:hypothetical protein N7463_010771 [Penicillium fimorum]